MHPKQFTPYVNKGIIGVDNCIQLHVYGECSGLVVRASEVGGRSSLGSLCCVLGQDTIYSHKVLVIHRKQWLRPDITEKLFTGKLSRKRKEKNVSNYEANNATESIRNADLFSSVLQYMI